MTSNRYLLYFSYIGTSYFGAQRQVSGIFPRKNDPSTIQGQLEMALKKLNPDRDPVIFLSSRTDSGVHALSSTCHVDLSRLNGMPYEPLNLTICLNKFFKKNSAPIRILKTYRVPNDFNSRFCAISRTYLYRLAVVNVEANSLNHAINLIPIEEIQRCHFTFNNEFDIHKMRECAKLFEGLHDFRTFMGRGSQDLSKITRRFMQRVEICDGNPFISSSYSWPTADQEKYKFYEIYVQATGFLYNQVRRMVASLLAVAQGKFLSSDIKLMLEVPSHRSWKDNIQIVPAHGLYLCRVDYSKEDISTFKD